MKSSRSKRGRSSRASSRAGNGRVWFIVFALVTAVGLVGYVISWKNVSFRSLLPAKMGGTASVPPTSVPAANKPKSGAVATAPTMTASPEAAPTLSVEPVARALRAREAAKAAELRQAAQAVYPHSVLSGLEAQVELARRGYSSGAIDGIPGAQTAAAIQAFQVANGLNVNGALDDATLAQLVISSPALGRRAISAADLARLQPLSPTWLGKSQQTALDYETALELIAERYHAHPSLIRQLNPDIDWDNLVAGTDLTVPLVDRVSRGVKAARVNIRLADHVLEAFDGDGKLLVHFPVSIARNVEKRPVGELHVTVVIPNPNYTFNPDVFPESEEARQLGRVLVIPPGPNNPVGVAWVGLDRPGYGMHGTPVPEQVGRTESHGCFRLANWDALALLDLAWVGLPVVVEP